jgi:hypothetical protein
MILLAYLQETGEDYGRLTPLVTTAGTLVSAAIALSLTWRRRAKWEPAEEDISRGPQRVAGVLTAVALAILWVRLSSPRDVGLATQLAVVFGVVCLVSLFVYGYLTSAMTYRIKVSRAIDEIVEQSVIGGFRLTRRAREWMREKQYSDVQNMLPGVGFDPHEIWTRHSRALAKQFFVAAYIALTVSGTLALSCAAIVLLLSPH